MEREERDPRQLYEEKAYILDYLLYGKPRTRSSYKGGPTVQMVGFRFFTLLEANVKSGVVLKPLDQVYVGKDNRTVVTYILGRIGYEQLTSTAKLELDKAIENIVVSRERKFVNFFNTAQAITPRMHALELIPGIGKKYMWEIIDNRENKLFESFQDIQNRISISNPTRLIAKRIIEELSSTSKYNLFTRSS